MKLSDYINGTKEEQIVEEIQQRNGRFFPITSKGKPIGLKTGYPTAREAVRAFYGVVLTTFKYLDPERQDALVNAYMEKRGLR
jgi:hypothetical protein